jgi:hypothetical protein
MNSLAVLATPVIELQAIGCSHNEYWSSSILRTLDNNQAELPAYAKKRLLILRSIFQAIWAVDWLANWAKNFLHAASPSW